MKKTGVILVLGYSQVSKQKKRPSVILVLGYSQASKQKRDLSHSDKSFEIPTQYSTLIIVNYSYVYLCETY